MGALEKILDRLERIEQRLSLLEQAQYRNVVSPVPQPLMPVVVHPHVIPGTIDPIVPFHGMPLPPNPFNPFQPFYGIPLLPSPFEKYGMGISVPVTHEPIVVLGPFVGDLPIVSDLPVTSDLPVVSDLPVIAHTSDLPVFSAREPAKAVVTVVQTSCTCAGSGHLKGMTDYRQLRNYCHCAAGVRLRELDNIEAKYRAKASSHCSTCGGNWVEAPCDDPEHQRYRRVHEL